MCTSRCEAATLLGRQPGLGCWLAIHVAAVVVDWACLVAGRQLMFVAEEKRPYWDCCCCRSWQWIGFGGGLEIAVEVAADFGAHWAAVVFVVVVH